MKKQVRQIAFWDVDCDVVQILYYFCNVVRFAGVSSCFFMNKTTMPVALRVDK